MRYFFLVAMVPFICFGADHSMPTTDSGTTSIPAQTVSNKESRPLVDREYWQEWDRVDSTLVKLPLADQMVKEMREYEASHPEILRWKKLWMLENPKMTINEYAMAVMMRKFGMASAQNDRMPAPLCKYAHKYANQIYAGILGEDHSGWSSRKAAVESDLRKLGYFVNVEEVTATQRHKAEPQSFLNRVKDCVDQWSRTDHGQSRTVARHAACFTIVYTRGHAACVGLMARGKIPPAKEILLPDGVAKAERRAP